MCNGEKISRRELEESGEVLREHDGAYQQSSDDSATQNKWEKAMKDVPSYEEHMEQLEEEEEMSM